MICLTIKNDRGKWMTINRNKDNTNNKSASFALFIHQVATFFRSESSILTVFYSVSSYSFFIFFFISLLKA